MAIIHPRAATAGRTAFPLARLPPRKLMARKAARNWACLRA